jgi:hypothetical protein
MTTTIYVDLRPQWYQVMESPVSSTEVRQRMEALAASALLQFVHQQSVRVTATEGGFSFQIERDRSGPPTRKSCPHCGGFL